jgi:hypothetical protein
MMVDMRKIMTRYGIPVIDDADMVLGMRIKRDRAKRVINLDQQLYIEKICDSHDLLTATASRTPEQLNVEQKALKDEIDAEASRRASDEPVTPPVFSDVKEYGCMVGQLLYCALSSRPDIAHACSVLARTLGRPQMRHTQQAKRCFKYLSGTRTLALKFGGGPITDTITLGESYSDSDWAGSVDDRRSTTGYIIKINNDTCIWQSKKQATIALSSAEAEYMAVSAAVTEIIWVRSLLKELGFEQHQPSVLRCDNKPAIAIANDDAHHARTKHIDIRHHFIRDHVRRGDVVVDWIPTAQNHADVLTKALSVEVFTRLRDAVMSKKEIIIRE